MPKFSYRRIPRGRLLLKSSSRKKPATVGGSTMGSVRIPSLTALTVQVHPEASAGPRDTGFLFDRFIDMMGGNA